MFQFSPDETNFDLLFFFHKCIPLFHYLFFFTSYIIRSGLKAKGNVAVNFTGGAQGLAILAVTSESYPDRIVFSGLIEDTKDRFLTKGYMWSSASKGSLSKKFKGDLSDLCKEYDDEKSKNKIARLREQVSVVQSTMQNNISKALDNLESTESLEASSEGLVASSEAFHRGAKKLAWKEWCMLMKMRFLIFLVFCVIVGIIIAVVCGDGACASKDSPAPPPATPTAPASA